MPPIKSLNLKSNSKEVANDEHLVRIYALSPLGWLGGAMVLGKLPVPGRPTLWMIIRQWPTALAVGAGGVVWTFLFSSIFSLLFPPPPPISGRRPDID